MDNVTDPTKPGVLTSEFWTNLLTILVTGFVGIAALFGKHLDGSSLQPLIGMGALIGMAISAAVYSHSRAKVKVGISQTIAAMQTPTLPDTSTDSVPVDVGANSTSAGGEQTLSDAEQQQAMSSRGETSGA